MEKIDKSELKIITLLILTLFLIYILSAFMIIKIKKDIDTKARISEAKHRICMNSRFLINSNNTCYNSETNELKIGIKRGLEDFVPKGIAVVFSNGNTIIINSMTNQSQVRMNNSEYGMPLEIPDYGQEKDYIIKISETGNPKEVRVAPIVSVGNSQKTCDISDKVSNIPSC